eukprot:6194373-Pleurochrysis_carterae.AAC.1
MHARRVAAAHRRLPRGLIVRVAAAAAVPSKGGAVRDARRHLRQGRAEGAGRAASVAARADAHAGALRRADAVAAANRRALVGHRAA